MLSVVSSLSHGAMEAAHLLSSEAIFLLVLARETSKTIRSKQTQALNFYIK